MSDQARKFTILGRHHCHLCSVMETGLRERCAGLAVEIEIIDVDSSPALALRYGEKVPVLLADGVEICYFRLDRRRLAEVLPAS